MGAGLSRSGPKWERAYSAPICQARTSSRPVVPSARATTSSWDRYHVAFGSLPRRVWIATTSCLDRYHGVIAARLDRHFIAAQAQRDRLERRSTRPTALVVEPATSAQDSATSAQDSATSAQDSATSAQDSAAPAAAATVHPIQCAAALPRAPVLTDSNGDGRDSPPLRRSSPASAAPSGGAVGDADAVWIAQLVQEALDQQARSALPSRLSGGKCAAPNVRAL